MIYLVSNFRTQCIHYKLEIIGDSLKFADPNWEPLSCWVVVSVSSKEMGFYKVRPLFKIQDKDFHTFHFERKLGII